MPNSGADRRNKEIYACQNISSLFVQVFFPIWLN